MNKMDIRPYTRQFYKNNKWRMALMLVQTVMITVLNLLISWLIKQLVDMMSGVDIGISFFPAFRSDYSGIRRNGDYLWF